MQINITLITIIDVTPEEKKSTSLFHPISVSVCPIVSYHNISVVQPRISLYVVLLLLYDIYITSQR